MVDDETGIDPVSADGEGATDDELSKRRGGKNGGSAKDRGADHEAAQAALDAEDDPPGEDDDGQTFLWEQGRKVTLSTLIAKGVPVEHVFVFGSKRTKGQGGLMSLDEQPILVVRGMAGQVKIVPMHDDNGKVTKVTVEQHVNAALVLPADSDQAEALIAPILAARADRREAV